LHFVQQIGIQQWADDHGTWQAHGVRLDLMDGPRRLTLCKLEVPQRQAEEWSRMAAQELESWAQALRELASVSDARGQLAQLVPVKVEAEDAGQNGWEAQDHVSGGLLGHATPAELGQVKSGDTSELAGTPLASLSAAHWRGELASRHRALLAAAPDVTAHSINPAWEQPSPLLAFGVSTAQMMARELLAAWAGIRDLRGPLITWAVQEAGMTRTDVHHITSVARGRINRLLRK
jgi:hypothetical protein